MNIKRLSESLKHLDHVYSLLDEPNVAGWRLFLSPLCKKIQRLVNFIFGDHLWHNNKSARKVVKYYLWKAGAGEITPERTEMIKKIVNRLLNIKHGSTTYGDGIDPSMLEAVVDVSKENTNGHLFHRVKGMPVADNKIFFHLHANKFGHDSELQGLPGKKALNYLQTFLQKRHEQKLPLYGLEKNLDVFYELEVAKLISSAQTLKSAKYHLKLALERNRPFLIHGGWTDVVSGHAIYYEVIPQPDKTVTLRLFNLGAGAESEQGKSYACQEWRGIDQKNIRSDSFVQAIWEMKNCVQLKGAQTLTNYGTEDVYSALKYILKPKETISGGENVAMKTLQQSGICSWKSLMAWICCKMKKEDYKNMIMDIKLQSLIDRVSVHSQKEKVGLLDFKLIQKSWRTSCKRLAQQESNGLISKRNFMSAKYVLNRTATWIQNHAGVQFQETAPANLKFKWQPKQLNPKFAAFCNHIQDKSKSAPATTLQKTIASFVVHDIEKYSDFIDASSFSLNLRELIARSQRAIENGEYQALHAGLTKVLFKLPPSELMKNPLKPDVAQALIKLLGELAHIYFKTFFFLPQAYILHSEKVLAFSKILETQELLTHFAQQPFLSEDEHITFRALDDQRKLGLRKSNLYFSAFNKKIISASSAVRNTAGTKIELGSISYKNNKIFEARAFHISDAIIDCIKRIDPNIESKLAKQDKNYISLPDNLRSLAIYTSELLPDWFKAMRDCSFYMEHLAGGAVAHSPALRGQSDLKVVYEIVKTEKTGYIKATLSGLNKDLEKDFPILKTLANNPEQRFMQMHRPFASEKLTLFMTAMNFWIQRDLISFEKLLCCINVKDYPHLKMKQEEFKELANLFFYSPLKHHDRLTVVKTLAYFTRHPQKLLDPDFQTLFKILIFNCENLNFEKDPHFVLQLEKFIKNGLEIAQQENNIQATVFFLQTSRYLSTYYPASKLFMEGPVHLRKLLATDTLSRDERSLVWGELMASHRNKDKIEAREVEEILKGMLYRMEAPVPAKWQEAVTDMEALESVFIHAKTFEQSLLKNEEPNHELLNSICSTPPNSRWKAELQNGSFPVFTSGEIRYNPIKGQLLYYGKETYIPQEIRDNPDFTKLFQGVDRAQVKNHNTYYFKDNYNRNVRVFVSKGWLFIEMEYENGWYRYLPEAVFTYPNKKNEIVCALQDRSLVNNYHHWQSTIDKSKIILLDPATQKKSHEVVLQYDKVISIKRVMDQALLSEPSTLLSRIEDTSYVQEWYDQNKNFREAVLERFQLPISVTPDPKNGHKLTTKMGRVIHPTKVTPIFGSYRNYCVVETKEGNRQVILPMQFLNIDLRKKESLLPQFKIERHLELNHQEKVPFFIYDIKPNGHLESDSSVANLYLAYVLALSQEYSSAAHYLKKYGIQPTPLGKVEELILINLISLGVATGDMSPEAVSLRVFAAHLLIENRQEELPSEIAKVINKELTHYLEGNKGHGIVDFSYRHAKAMLDKLKDNKSNPQQQKVEIEPSVLTLNKPPNLNKKKKINLNDILITRPGKYIHENFLFFYQIAKKGSAKDKKWISDCLGFLYHRHHRNVNVNNNSRLKIYFDNLSKDVETGYAQLLETILAHPDAFPDIPKAIDQNMTAWWNNILTIASTKAIVRKEKTQPKKEKKLPKLDEQTSVTEKMVLPITLNYEASNTPLSFAAQVKSENCFIETRGSTCQRDEALNSCAKWLKTQQETSTNKMLANEYHRLASDDFSGYKKELEDSKSYTLTPEGMSKIKGILQKDEKLKKLKLVELRNSIREKANKGHMSEWEHAKAKNRVDALVKRKITFRKVMIAYGRSDPQLLRALNPYLTDEDINFLFKDMEEFLLLNTHEQQRERCLKIYKKLKHLYNNPNHDKKDSDYLSQELGEAINEERQYSPKDFPAFLALENALSILIRKNQLETLTQFLKSGDVRLIKEMIMASGKSKVLLPLLGLLRADGSSLSLLIVLKALLETCAKDTHNVSLKAYAKILKSFEFDRNTRIDNNLTIQLAQMSKMITNKEGIMMTSKSIQSMILKFIEMCDKHFSSTEFAQFSPKINQLADLLNLISNSNSLLDEADSLLNILHEICFSIGDSHSPEEQDIQVESLLYELLFSDEDIKGIAKLECDPNPSSNTLLTRKLYDDSLKRTLAVKFIQKLKTAEFTPAHLQEKFRNYANNLNEMDLAKTLNYLTQNRENAAQAQAYFDGIIDEEIQDMLSLASIQISTFLPHTLMYTSDENYGINGESSELLALPFSGARSPNNGSQFSNEHITINYTIQSYIKNPIPTNILKSGLERLQKRIIRDQHKGLPKEKSQAWIYFCALKGSHQMSLNNLREADLQFISKKLEGKVNFREKLKFIQMVILPNLEINENTLSCNALNLAAFLKKGLGFTGTLWNGKSMHHKFSPLHALGTDLKTITLLWQNSMDAVISLKESSTESMLKQLHSSGYDLLVDSGGYFKQDNNYEIAKKMESIEKMPVVYLNNNILTSTSPTTKLSIDKRKTFLGQIHSLGMDIPQKSDAIGIVTISRNMLLRDLLQAVWRLRQLDKNQKIIFAISGDVEQLIRASVGMPDKQTITFKEILQFTLNNQVMRQGLDNLKALKQELASIPQGILLDVLLDKNFTMEEKKKVSDKLKNIWIKPARGRCKDQFGKMNLLRKTSEIVSEEKSKCQTIIDELSAECPFIFEKLAQKSKNTTPDMIKKSYVEGIDNAIKKMEGFLPEEALSPNFMDETMEKEQEKQTEKDRDTEVQTDVEGGFTIGAMNPIESGKFEEYEHLDNSCFDRKSVKMIPLSQVLSHDKKLSAYAEAFMDVRISFNCLQWPFLENKLEALKLLGPQRIPIQFLSIEGDKVWMLSDEEARKIADGSPKQLYNMSLGFLYDTQELTPVALEKVVKIKFFSGESAYSQQEAEFLKKWIVESGVTKMRKLFVEEILPGQHSKIEDFYDDSSLLHVFNNR